MKQDMRCPSEFGKYGGKYGDRSTIPPALRLHEWCSCHRIQDVVAWRL